MNIEFLLSTTTKNNSKTMWLANFLSESISGQYYNKTSKYRNINICSSHDCMLKFSALFFFKIVNRNKITIGFEVIGETWLSCKIVSNIY